MAHAPIMFLPVSPEKFASVIEMYQEACRERSLAAPSQSDAAERIRAGTSGPLPHPLFLRHIMVRWGKDPFSLGFVLAQMGSTPNRPVSWMIHIRPAFREHDLRSRITEALIRRRLIEVRGLEESFCVLTNPTEPAVPASL